MKNDLVSIILPVYNGEPYLSAAIESIINQTHQNFELLILDDGSTDLSLSTIARYACKDGRIKFWSRENRGLGASLNELIGYASSEFIARMDSDDVCEPDRIALQYSFLKSNMNVGLVGGQISFLVGDNIVPAHPMPSNHFVIRSAFLRARFPICHPSIMFRKSISNIVGGYKIAGAGEDLDFFLRVSEVSLVTNIPQKVLRYRIHLQSLSVSRSAVLNKAYSYSIENARRRVLGVRELTPTEFDSIWARRPVTVRFMHFSRNISEIFYRRAIQYRAVGRTFHYFSSMFIAAILRPRVTFTKIFDWMFGHERS